MFTKSSKVLALLGIFASICYGEAGPVQFNGMGDSVVMIHAVSQSPDYDTPWKDLSMRQGVGSGLIIDGERILTNAHNIADSKYIILKKQNNAQKYIGMVEFVGHDCDLAVLKVIQPAGFFEGTTPLEIGDLPAINSTVQTYGFPIGGTLLSVTEGVVSRIQFDRYSHSAGDSHLVVQTDAAINPGNSGGPVMQDGKVVGIAFQGLTTADNIGYMIPTTVINHFLEDIEDGKYDGFASLGVSYYAGLHNKAYCELLKLPEGQEGVVVTGVYVGGCADGVLAKGDCLVKIENYEVDNDGNVLMHGLKLSLAEVIEQYQIGDEIEIEIYRDGELVKKNIKLCLDLPLVPFSKEFDKKPRFFTIAGFVFTPVSRNYLETWGNEWVKDIPSHLKLLFYHSIELNKDPEMKEYVVLSEILPDSVNSYDEEFKNSVIKSVNGVKITSLDDAYANIIESDSDFIKIEFVNRPEAMIIERASATAANESINQKYDVTITKRLEN